MYVEKVQATFSALSATTNYELKYYNYTEEKKMAAARLPWRGRIAARARGNGTLRHPSVIVVSVRSVKRVVIVDEGDVLKEEKVTEWREAKCARASRRTALVRCNEDGDNNDGGSGNGEEDGQGDDDDDNNNGSDDEPVGDTRDGIRRVKLQRQGKPVCAYLSCTALDCTWGAAHLVALGKTRPRYTYGTYGVPQIDSEFFLQSPVLVFSLCLRLYFPSPSLPRSFLLCVEKNDTAVIFLMITERERFPAALLVPQRVHATKLAVRHWAGLSHSLPCAHVFVVRV